ncbi:MAG: MBL fold metallo-hydrolase [Gammaproteobacteria bacterium]|nr:MBL fold metallo-hydrolase [Gammaproteobacteria bacterium]
MSAPLLTSHPHGITTVDSGYRKPGLVASHLIVHGGRAAFVDVGANSAVTHLLGALARLGVAREAVDYVILTHAHLDHAGGAGALMHELPAARAVLHPRAAPHLIEPEKLIAGTRAVYGAEAYQRMYGEIQPIPAERVRVTADGQHLDLAGRALEFLHTPGHALHHQVIADEQSASVFAGDTFGVSYRELDTDQGAFIVPTTTPTQFDPVQLLASIDRILARRPQSVYLTHYGRVGEVERLGAMLKAQVHELAAMARRHAAAADRYAAIHAEMRALWLRRLREHGCTLDEHGIDALLGMDADLNTQGLIVWLDRERK